MPLVIPDDCANWHLTMTNVLGGISARTSIAIATQNTTPLDQGIVGRVANLLRDGLAPLMDTGWTLGPTHVVEGGSPNLIWDDTGTEAGTGGAAQAGVPPGLALVVTKRTGIAGRAYRGRVYVPGLKEGDVDEAGIILGAFVNTAQAAFDALRTALVADAAIDFPVLLHSEGTPSAGLAHEINSFLVRNVVGSMRPRQRR